MVVVYSLISFLAFILFIKNDHNYFVQFQALTLLHKSNYDVGKASLSLVPDGGPILCRDEMEEWTSGQSMTSKNVNFKVPSTFLKQSQRMSISITNRETSIKTFKIMFLFFSGEATLFEEGIRKHGKEFNEIQQEYVSSCLR